MCQVTISPFTMWRSNKEYCSTNQSRARIKTSRQWSSWSWFVIILGKLLLLLNLNFWAFWGNSLITKPPFGVTLAEVAIICPVPPDIAQVELHTALPCHWRLEVVPAWLSKASGLAEVKKREIQWKYFSCHELIVGCRVCFFFGVNL